MPPAHDTNFMPQGSRGAQPDRLPVLQGTKNSKKLANGYPEPKRVLENGMKAAHDTAASAAAHAKAAHLPSDSKIAQMSSKPMAHVEAKGKQPPATCGRACSRGSCACKGIVSARQEPASLRLTEL